MSQNHAGSVREPRRGPQLVRFAHNPILRPIMEHHWESKAVFNAAALLLGGKIHMGYRAIGDDDRSVVGYAASRDGFMFPVRHDLPMYLPRAEFEGSVPNRFRLSDGIREAGAGQFASGGGGWGGTEDPRFTHIDGRIYVTYSAYNGWSEPRAAIAWISEEDFLAQRWDRWSMPKLISRPGRCDNEIIKNVVIFPDKIGGRYAILHRQYPEVHLHWCEDLEFAGDERWLEIHHTYPLAKEGWDTHKFGAGATPLKTDRGWLIIYQGVGGDEPGRYKIGAMLLDLSDPTKIIARSKAPVLSPDEWYENAGYKAGVIYPCGAVIMDGKLFVYYGGADTLMNGAWADLGQFLDDLIEGEQTVPADAPAPHGAGRIERFGNAPSPSGTRPVFAAETGAAVGKKTPVMKTAGKRGVGKKAPAKKPAVSKTPAKKSAAGQRTKKAGTAPVSAKTPAMPKTPAKKPGAKRVSTRSVPDEKPTAAAKKAKAVPSKKKTPDKATGSAKAAKPAAKASADKKPVTGRRQRGAARTL
jgi:predicted GH43/DUF377 family glycosyl hydrolase